MKRRNRDGTITDIPADDQARRRAEQDALVEQEAQAKQRRRAIMDALADGAGAVTRAEMNALKAALRAQFGLDT